jgi:lipoprotein-anchoring transpeptidase ErfK/SrfK
MAGMFRPVATRGALLALVLSLVVSGAASAHARATGLSVFFPRGEQLARVSRPGATPTQAVRQLLAGLTPAEVKLGYRTYVPGGTRVLSVKVANGLATVDLNDRFISGTSDDNKLARLSQLVRTLTGLQGTTQVQLLIEGKKVDGVFPGIPTAGPITFRFLRTPDIPVPKPPPLRLPPPDAHVKAAQKQLITLGYLLKGDDDGQLGPGTKAGILAFQKWEGLDRTSLLDAATTARLKTASHPTPLTQGGSGKRAEILIDRQVALLIANDRVVRTIAVSTGKASTPTPPGDYHVYAKIPRWWSVPFREWLPWALPFVGGIAFHEFLEVPVYPASHGCVRQPVSVAHWTFDFAYVGMPVKVIAKT